MKPYRVILADDHVLLRQGLKRIIEGQGDIEVIGEAGDGHALLGLVKNTNPDLVIVDISMPDFGGIEAIRALKALRPEAKALVLTMHREKEYLDRSRAAGADGYLLKEDADTELFSAIHAIREGGTFISPRISAEPSIDSTRSHRTEWRSDEPEESLSSREREVLKLVAEGKSNKEIADLLYISIRTVEHHRANIMRRLKIKKTAELIKYAIKKSYL